MTAVLVTVFAGLLLAGGPRLARARWVVRAPGLALLVWQMTCAAVVMSVSVAGLTSVLHWDDTHNLMCSAWRLCLDALYGDHGRVAQAGAVAGAAVLAVTAGRLLHAAWRVQRADRAHGRRMREVIRSVGSREPGLGATVLPSPEAAAYLVPGGHRDVVVTSGALRRLSPDELRAVMAHEHAHASGRHYRLLRTARMLHRAFPRVPLFRLAEDQVHRLVELHADDVAVRSAAPLSLARALVTMAESRAAQAPGGPLLAAAGGDAAERLERLLCPPAPLPSPAARVAAVVAALLPLVPILLALAGRQVTLL
ncbi:M56 family metallopeptidase [Dactylosporangium sp. AC04546]|uniref:M56 family metallopeptidase n=1 Tax=Dactylosporangium sp. AC04546 TaxID=2862460 RepID=UPI001EE02479|nr:M56 family metallopeptidase [Dactylosporangium sp. AC04546]WVK86495.1 M56 family metallopeptidase [Dactylosporangium sp. AC04546]